MIHLPFTDRFEAGRMLAAELAHGKLPLNRIVLALPRGGVPVGFAVARALHAPLDVAVVRKLGVPWQPELAMGAIAGGSFQILDEELIQELGIHPEEIAEVVSKERQEVERREMLYRGGRPPPYLRGRTVVLVDDGLATGSTMLVAARFVRSLQPAKLIVAVPVGSVEACRRLNLRPNKECDECLCLATPEPFGAVGEWYGDFREVSDADVQRLLSEPLRVRYTMSS